MPPYIVTRPQWVTGALSSLKCRIYILNIKYYTKQHIWFINSVWLSEAIWPRRSSTLAQIMACCLAALSHYLDQCWLIISKVQWDLFESNFMRDTSTIIHKNELEGYLPKILFKSLRGQWVHYNNMKSDNSQDVAEVWCNKPRKMVASDEMIPRCEHNRDVQWKSQAWN